MMRSSARKWSEWNGTTITPEQILCEGCRNNGRKFVYCASLCPIRKCAAEKGFSTCGDCRELESCGKIAEILDNAPEAKDNLRKG